MKKFVFKIFYEYSNVILCIRAEEKVEAECSDLLSRHVVTSVIILLKVPISEFR